MNLFDLVFVLITVASMIGGYRLGFTSRALSWLGLGVGLVAGLRAVPWLLNHTTGARYELVAAATVSIVLLPAVIGETVGNVVGRRVTPRSERAARVDRLVGAAAGLFIVSATTWLILPVLTASVGWPQTFVSDSAIEQLMTDHLPAPPNVEAALRPLVGADTFPQVFEALQPSVAIDPPMSTGLDQATVERIAASVVRIEGVACRFTKSGSGFVVADDLVITNAHVVAGEPTTEIERSDGKTLSAIVVAFDAESDLALLRVKNLDRAALPVGSPNRGDAGGVFGHPEGGPLRVAPFEVARLAEAIGKDIYDTAIARRDVLEIAADLQHGDSGAALVDINGDVVGVAFAISTDQDGVAYALATTEVKAIMATPHEAQVDTGPCID